MYDKAGNAVQVGEMLREVVFALKERLIENL